MDMHHFLFCDANSFNAVFNDGVMSVMRCADDNSLAVNVFSDPIISVSLTSQHFIVNHTASELNTDIINVNIFEPRIISHK